jgi:hypothetical protein
MHRELAKSRTRTAQLLAGGLVAGAVLVATVPGSLLDGGSGDAPETNVTAAAPVKAAASPAPTASLADPRAVAAALDGIAPPPPVAPPKIAEANVPTEAPAPVVAAPPAPWRFIGVIVGQTRENHRAFVALSDSKQKMVREGDKIDSDTVDEIHGRYLLVTGADGAQRRVDIGVPERAKIAVVATSTGSANADAAALAAARAGQVDEGYKPSPEEIEFLRKEIEAGTFAAYIDPSLTNYAMKSPEEIAMMVATGELRPGKFGGRTGVGPRDPEKDGAGINELDAMRRLTRLRMQNLDDSYQNGIIDREEFDRRQRLLEQDMPTPEQIEGWTKGQPTPPGGPK